MKQEDMVELRIKIDPKGALQLMAILVVMAANGTHIRVGKPEIKDGAVK